MKSFVILSILGVQSLVFNTIEDGPVFQVEYDAGESMFKFQAVLQENAVLTLAFNSDPVNNQSDLAVFTASGAGTLVDKWGTLSLASNDFQQNWKNVLITKEGMPQMYTFVGYRMPNTGDPFRKDTVMPCGETSNYVWSLGAQQTGNWTLTTDADCNVLDPNATTPPQPASGATWLSLGSLVALSVSATAI